MIDDQKIGEIVEATEFPSLFLTKGFRLIMPLSDSLLNKRDRKTHFRCGLHHEVAVWLRDNVGPFCRSYEDWETGDDSVGNWLYAGAQQRGGHRPGEKGVDTMTLWFRHKSHALMFKLTWAGRL